MRHLLAASALLSLALGTSSSEAEPDHQLPPAVIHRVVRASFGKFRQCYEDALRNCPNLQGRVSVKFVIQPHGGVTNVSTKDSDIPDAAVARCVGNKFKELVFPAFKGPPMRVSYPVMFSPGS